MQPGPYGVRPGQYFAGQQYPQMYMQPTAGSPYGSAPGATWPTQQPSTAAVAYGNPPGYAPSNYGPYYNNARTPSQSDGSVGKTDQTATSQSMAYGGQYAPAPYPGMGRNGSQSTPTMMQSAYQTPVQQSSSTFGAMGGRQSYGGNNVTSPTTNGPTQQQYGSAAAQAYGVRSPTQNYGMQSTPASAVAQSPQAGVKSPNPGAQGSAPPAQMGSSDGSMSYRSGTYGVAPTPQSANPGGDMPGLGISSSPQYPAPPQQGQTYSGYGASPVSAAQSGAQYGQ